MITQTEVELYVRIKPYYEFVEFVSTMPGMTELSSTIVLAETGVDMDIFDDAKHLCSWCGLSNPLVRKSLSALPKQAIT